MISELVYEFKKWREHRWPLSTLIWNVRFVVGYRIGGFTSASTD